MILLLVENKLIKFTSVSSSLLPSNAFSGNGEAAELQSWWLCGHRCHTLSLQKLECKIQFPMFEAMVLFRFFRCFRWHSFCARLKWIFGICVQSFVWVFMSILYTDCQFHFGPERTTVDRPTEKKTNTNNKTALTSQLQLNQERGEKK